MRSEPRILVVGPPTLCAAVQAAAPSARAVAVDGLLTGVWTAGQHEFDAVVVRLAGARHALRALECLRQAAPQARLVATCPAAQEPAAREALHRGADEYVLEPVEAADLAVALGLAPARPTPAAATAPGAAPSPQELAQLGEVLRCLGDGLAPTLRRLAALVREACGAEAVQLHYDATEVLVGPHAAPVLSEPLRRQDDVVGELALGPARRGVYSSADAARLAHYARLIETVCQQVAEQARWRELAWRDDLSGLHNRRYFDAALDRLLAQAAAERTRLTVLLFDIDNFKGYNDHYGHATGDALIREVAVLLTRCSREPDVVARYGGDEFAVLLWDAEQPRVAGSQHPRSAHAFVQRFEAVIRAHDFKCLGAGAPGPVTLSGGLATFPWDGSTREGLLRAADEALLRAKRNGKNHIALACEAPDDVAGLPAAEPAPAPSDPPDA